MKVLHIKKQHTQEESSCPRKIYNTTERPICRSAKSSILKFFVDALRTGAEYREGTTPFLVGIRNKQTSYLI